MNYTDCEMNCTDLPELQPNALAHLPAGGGARKQGNATSQTAGSSNLLASIRKGKAPHELPLAICICLLWPGVRMQLSQSHGTGWTMS